MTIRLIALLTAFALLPAARADVTPHELFTDGVVLQADRENAVWGKADPGEKVTVTLGDAARSVKMKPVEADAAGHWLVKLPALEAMADEDPTLTMTIQGKNTVTLKNVLIGEVWICSGQSNMQWAVSQSHEAEKVIAAAKDARLRLYSVPRTTSMTLLSAVPHAPDPKGQYTRWYETTPDTVKNFSAVAYHFGQHLRKARKVPVGLIHTSWGGTPAEAWTSRPSLDAEPTLSHYGENLSKAIRNYNPDQAEQNHQKALAKWEKDAATAKAAGKPAPRKPTKAPPPDKSQHSPSLLYNAMIAPLIPYGIAGAIWYQGESNAGRAFEYRTLFPTMIKDWRRNWGQGEFPFLFVQLAPFEKTNAPWPELREAQLMTLSLPKTAMAVITDVGEADDIHPKKKEPVGARLALAARTIAYGESVTYSGPIFDSMKVEGNRAVLTFKHAGLGLECRGDQLTGFTIAGDDQKFVEAEARITGPNTLAVSSAQVAKPAAVRYGWANFPKVNLWNRDGLPATPFRTDAWEMQTKK